MLKLGELKAGDIIKVNDDGIEREGAVVEISHEEHQALVDNGVQEFWYSPEDMSPIPVDEHQLLKLGFQKQDLNGEGMKYMKGAFRIVVSHVRSIPIENAAHHDDGPRRLDPITKDFGTVRQSENRLSHVEAHFPPIDVERGHDFDIMRLIRPNLAMH